MSYYGISDIGLVREENQDYCTALELCENAELFVVCDGMGGENGGKLASSKAGSAFSEMLSEKVNSVLQNGKIPSRRKKDIPSFLVAAVEHANTAVYELAASDRSLKGMGTTLVAALIVDQTAFVVNIGDSRAYISYYDSIKQITKDHSYVQFLVDMGKITPEEASNHPQKNVITRSVGAAENVIADIFKLSLVDGQYILLCTDGLSNSVSEQEIGRALMKNEPLKNKAEGLVRLAKLHESSDNITALLIKFEK